MRSAWARFVALASCLLGASCSLLLDTNASNCSGSSCATRVSPSVSAGAGGGAGTAAAGAMAAKACSATCAAPTPVCDANQDRCVQCAANSDCPESAPICDADNGTCIECRASDDCDRFPGRPTCDDETHLCVQCLSNGDCQGAGVCDPDQHRCVSCSDDSDCKTPTKSHCDREHNVCVGCSLDNECQHLLLTRVCDRIQSRCVQCTLETETQACKGNVCDLGTHACTDMRRGSKKVCERCTFDSECPSGNNELNARDHRCIDLAFNGLPLHAYCLKTRASGCSAPYTKPIEMVASTSHAPADSYCGIDELRTTCEAVRDVGKSCTPDQESVCGDPEIVADGACRNVQGAENRCTFPCDNAEQCPDALACTDMYCQ